MKAWLFIIIIFAINAEAKIRLGLSTSYITQNFSTTIKGKESKSVETRNPMDIKLGWENDNGTWYYGILSHSGGRTVQTAKDTQAYKRSAIGPTIGYNFTKTMVHFSYLMNGKSVNPNEVVWQKGSGYQLDFGWFVKFSKSVLLIPGITYRSLSYKEKVVKGGDPIVVDASTDSEIIPQITFWMAF